jgi:spermidine synthase
MAFASHNPIRWLASYFSRQRILSRSSLHHPHLEVVQIRGKKILDGAHVNYSFGGLHEVFAQTFEKLDVGKRQPRSVLLLGLGAGSVVHLLRLDHGIAAPIVAVEIDPVMIEVARKHFGLDRWRDLEIVVDDARAFVERDARAFDLVVVDLFIDARIPDVFRTRDFLRRLGQLTAPGGLLVYNQVANRPAARADAIAFAAYAQTELGGVRVIEARGNLVLAWEKPRGGTNVADGLAVR